MRKVVDVDWDVVGCLVRRSINPEYRDASGSRIIQAITVNVGRQAQETTIVGCWGGNDSVFEFLSNENVVTSPYHAKHRFRIIRLLFVDISGMY